MVFLSINLLISVFRGGCNTTWALPVHCTLRLKMSLLLPKNKKCTKINLVDKSSGTKVEPADTANFINNYGHSYINGHSYS